MDQYLAATPLVDWTHERIDALFTERGWEDLPPAERVAAAHDFVRDEIPFGYNRHGVVPASRVLEEGIGQVHAKTTVLMALLRRGGIPCRFHAFAASKRAQAGVMLEGLHDILPENVPHAWVEALLDHTWISLEGCIVDSPLLASVQSRFDGRRRDFCGYGIAVDDLLDPPNAWSGGDTFIQHRAIRGDLGVFASPDEFHAEYGAGLSAGTALRWRWLYFAAMNHNIVRIRAGDFPEDAERFVSRCPRGLFPIA